MSATEPRMAPKNETAAPTKDILPGATSLRGGVEPTTPTGEATRQHAQSPLIEKISKQGAQEEEPRKYHEPWGEDPKHGEQLFPMVKGHEAEEYEQIEAYASPEDVSPEIKKRAEEHEHGHWEESAGAGELAGSHRHHAEQQEKKPAEDTKETPKAGATPQGAVAHAKEVAKRVACVTVNRVAVMVQATKVKAGIPAEKPLTAAAKEAVGLSPEKTIGESAREATAAAADASRTKAQAVSEQMRRVTVEALHGAKESVMHLPDTMRGIYAHGKALAEEKDRQQAQGAGKHATSAVMAETKEGGEESLLPPASSLMTKQAGQMEGGDGGGSSGGGAQTSQQEKPAGFPLPVPISHFDQTTGGKMAERHGEGGGPEVEAPVGKLASAEGPQAAAYKETVAGNVVEHHSEGSGAASAAPIGVLAAGEGPQAAAYKETVAGKPEHTQ